MLSFFAALLLLGGGGPGDPPAAADPGTCVSCHQPAPGAISTGHLPFVQGRCQACHVRDEAESASARSRIAGGRTGSGSFPDFRLPEGARSPSAAASGPLLLRDPLPTRYRAVALARPEQVAASSSLWVREGAGGWQRLPVERRNRGAATEVSGIRPEARVEVRRGVVGKVAVLTLEGPDPMAARVQVGGRTVSSRAGYYASELTLRVPLGAESPEVLPVEWWTLHRAPQTLAVDLQAPPDRSIRATAVDYQPATLATLEEFAGRTWLVVESPQAVRLEVRAPAQPKRAPLRSSAFVRDGPGAPGGIGPAGRDSHSGLADGDWAGLQACLKCHPKTADPSSSHPLVQAKSGRGYALPEELPLGSRGQILCSTCHEPHGGGQHSFMARLDPRRELCIQCHAEFR